MLRELRARIAEKTTSGEPSEDWDQEIVGRTPTNVPLWEIPI